MKQSKSFLKIILIVLLGLILITCQKEEQILSTDTETETETEANLPQLKSASASDLLGLIETISEMVNDGLINKGNGNALIAKIRNAIRSMDNGNTDAANGQLLAFVNQVEDFIIDDKLALEEGQSMIDIVENGNILPDDSFLDTRDNHVYSIVEIGEQIWMAENMAYIDEALGIIGLAYDYDESNVAMYGRLYNWDNALKVCPTGWHLPDIDDWEQLSEYVSNNNGGYVKTDISTGYYWNNVGTHLKSINGWDPVWGNAGATDDYGFTALGAGFHTTVIFSSLGQEGHWWSSNEYDDNNAYQQNVIGYRETFATHYLRKYYSFSVRCLKD